MHTNDDDLEFFTDDDIDEYHESFSLASQHIQTIHDKIMPNDLLELYGLYKQATCGLCTTPKPNVFNIQARAKWSAWHDLNGQMTTSKAKQLYFEKVVRLDPSWWEAIKNGDKIHAKSHNSWVVYSTPTIPEDHINKKSDIEKTIFDFVREHNLKKVQIMFRSPEKDMYDDCGMALIHWAADGDNVEILKFLLDSGCSIDLRDKDQKQTALHYAASCGHVECVNLLLQYGADKSIKDIDGQTCFDVADDPFIRSLLQTSKK